MYSTLKNGDKLRPLTARGAKEGGATEFQLTARKVDGDKVLTSRRYDPMEPYSVE
jgi:phosphohistidine phosphatase SixA